MKNQWTNTTPMALGIAAGLALLGAYGNGGASHAPPLVATAAAAEPSPTAAMPGQPRQRPVTGDAAVRSPGPSECEEKLADLDRKIEEGLDMDEAEAAALKQMRDTAARLCAAGQPELAIPLLDGLLQRLEADDEDADEDADEPAGEDLAALTIDYLQGRWCAVSTSTGETGPYVFNPDGSYQVGIRAGDDYSMRPGGADLDAFRSVFHRLDQKAPDRFVVYRHSYRTEFTRGECPGQAGA